MTSETALENYSRVQGQTGRWRARGQGRPLSTIRSARRIFPRPCFGRRTAGKPRTPWPKQPLEAQRPTAPRRDERPSRPCVRRQAVVSRFGITPPASVATSDGRARFDPFANLARAGRGGAGRGGAGRGGGGGLGKSMVSGLPSRSTVAIRLGGAVGRRKAGSAAS